MVRTQTLKINQVIIYNGPVRTLFSYDTPIASITDTGKVILHNAWNYSATTNRYRGEFLGEGIAATREKLLTGEYGLKDYYGS